MCFGLCYRGRVYTTSFLSFSLFLSQCLYHCPAISWLITVSAYTSLLRVSYSLSLWISVLVFGGYIVTHWSCICTSLDPCFSLSYLWMLLSVLCYIVTDCQYIVSSHDLYFFLCFFESVSVSASLDRVCFCLSLWRSVVVIGYIVIDCRCIFPCLDRCFSLFLCEYISQRSAILSLIVGAEVRILIRVSLSLSFSLSVSVSPYIVGNCMCIRTFLDSYFFLSLCL